ncbi:flagellar hook protein FlgE [Verticiella sediminum]|uniref:Flagellar hook protein FlgE n=1 Tax=Verticiella sediminum TaxID=1247510 RepID=A0A556ARW3_9BURK|nr:flagellar hook protein FlgE [Verticiella sediminum]TSH95679.1 flagellar hook protein FlgE [Verticiella sediminum]
MGFGQALSGLNAASQNLDVIGNNIANASTVGYKSGSINFADIYASSRIGLGVQVSSIQQRFTTGNLEITGNQYDMAIDGNNGFFRLINTNGEIVYSRNGQFTKDKDNYIVNAQGMRLTGYPADVLNEDGTLISGVGQDPVQLIVPAGNIAPQATTAMNFERNLDSREPAIDGAVYPFDANDPSTFTNSVPMTVYDSLGNRHTLTQYYIKRGADNGESIWEVRYMLDDDAMTVGDGNADFAELRFTSSGTLVPGSQTAYTVNFAQPGTADAPADPLAIQIAYAGSSQFGSAFTQNFTQNGYASGEFASIAVGAGGEVIASYTNGQTQNIGTLVLANFNNVTGLKAVGGNAWSESPESGQAILGQPGTNGLATIKGQAVEASNVDMSQELVNMIIAQRTYQANAQTIKTQDQIMQTLMAMR